MSEQSKTQKQTRLIITGMGRSGTLFASRLFQTAGLNIGHQEAFDRNVFFGWGDLDGDSSNSAAPHVGEFIDDNIVIHQVRDKDRVVRSIIYNGHASSYLGEGEEWDTAEELYDYWNGLVSKYKDHPNYIKINVEDYTPEFVNSIVDRLGRGHHIEKISIPKDTGHNPNDI